MERQLPSEIIKSLKRTGHSSLVLALPLLLLSWLFHVMAGQAKPVSDLATAKPLAVICDDCTTNVPVHEQTDNLVPNPGFETEIPLPGEWDPSGKCPYEWDCTEGHNNSSCSAKLYPDGHGDCEWITNWRIIDVSENTYYDFVGWIKTDFALGTDQAHIEVKFRGKNGQPIGDYCTSPIYGNTDWISVTGRVYVPERAAHVEIHCGARNATGIMWCDDVFFGPSVGLEITKDDSSDPVGPGELLTYTLVYSNVGCEPATNVCIVDIYDDHTEYITSTPPSTRHTNDEWCFDDPLSPGDRGAITVTVWVLEDTGGSSVLVNEALMESHETEILASNLETTTVEPAYNCEMEITQPILQPRQYLQGAVRYPYQYQVFNTGNHSGTVTITAQYSPEWPVETQPVTATLSPGNSVQALSTVVVSNDILSGTLRPWGITATLTCPLVDDTATDTVSITTTAQRVIELDVSPGISKSAQMATAVAFTHTVTNTGNWTDTLVFGCDFDPNLVACASPTAPVPLAKQQPALVTALLTDTGCGFSMPATIVVTSTANPNKFRLTANVLTAHYSATLSPGTSRIISAGTRVSLTHVLTMLSNLGNCEDTFTLTTASSQDWATPTQLPPIILTVEPRVITIPVDVSSEAPVGDQATITVTATSHFRPAIRAPAIDTLTIEQDGDVEISPGVSRPAQDGTPVAFVHTVTNTGNWTDTLFFDCDFDPNLVACAPPTAPITLAKHQTTTVTVTLTDVGCGIHMPATIVITSTAGASNWATDVLTAHYSATLSPGTLRIISAGTRVSLTHVLTMLSNLGNCEDTFTLTATSSQDWAAPTPLSSTILTVEPRVITVPVDVSSEALAGDQATITVTATSHFSPAIHLVVADILDYYKVYLPLVFRNYPPLPDLSTSQKWVAWSQDDPPAPVHLTFTIDLINTGTLTATDIRLTDTIPTETTLIPGSIEADINCWHEAATDQIICSDSLGINEHASISFMVEVNSCVPPSNTAYVDDGYHPPLPLTVLLPEILGNGDFESGDFAPCWHEVGPISRVVVPLPLDTDYNCFDSFSARLGNPDYPSNNVPVGNGTIYQSVTLPPSSSSPQLKFDYCMISWDQESTWTGYPLDTFEVTVDGIDLYDDDPNLLLRTGNPGSRPEENPWESDCRSVDRDLSAYVGQTITLYFSVWNRGDNMYNTWVYVDNIQVLYSTSLDLLSVDGDRREMRLPPGGHRLEHRVHLPR